jgi:hypothetical protein
MNTSHLRLGDELMGGIGYLMIEINGPAVFRGLGEFYLGPLEAA